jgi:hypothetical protein
MRTAALLTVALLCCLSCLAWAGTQESAVVALHVATPAKSPTGPCEQHGFNPCSSFFVAIPPLTEYCAFLIVAKADSLAGIAGLSCGVLTSNIAIDAWLLCADAQSPSAGWPQTGGGNRITWDGDLNCQRGVVSPDGVHALAGVFAIYAYSGDGFLEMTPNYAASESDLLVTDCGSSVSTLQTAGARIGSGTTAGINPCADDVPVTQRTWGRIKQQYD